MKTKSLRRELWVRPTALVVAGAMLTPTLVGCGGGGAETASAPPSSMGGRPMNSRPMGGQRPTMGQQGGMTGKQKMMLLAGAAALYYIYNKRKNAAAKAGPQGKYFLSKNGRVYYRDLKTGQFQYVSPPSQPIQVPAEEAQAYSGFQGYNNGRQGKQFGGYGYNNSGSYNDAVPAPAF